MKTKKIVPRDKPVTIVEAAKIAGCSVASIKKYLKAKILKGVKFGRQWMIEPSSISSLPPQDPHVAGRRRGSKNKEKI